MSTNSVSASNKDLPINLIHHSSQDYRNGKLSYKSNYIDVYKGMIL